LLQLGFEPFKKGESIRRRSGKTGQDFVVIHFADFLGLMLDYRLAHGDLSVSGHHDLSVFPNGKNRRAVNGVLFHDRVVSRLRIGVT